MSQIQEESIQLKIIEGPALQTLQAVAAWHKVGSEQIVKLLENNKPGTKLHLTGQDPAKPAQEIVLTEEMAKGFGIALILALGALGNLPFSLEPAEARDAEFEEVPGQ